MSDISIEIINEPTSEYIEFLGQADEAMLFQEANYLKLISNIAQSQIFIFLARNARKQVVGVLPAIMIDGKYGSILNALPFYGSHAGPVVTVQGDALVKLSQKFFSFSKEKNCATSTLICSPFMFLEKQKALSEDCVVSYVDSRIGQMTYLPQVFLPDESLEDRLMSIFHSKTRNMVRKSQKEGLVHQKGCNEKALAFLESTHNDNMSVIGGTPKPREFFSGLKDTYIEGEQYQIYTAFDQGEPVAALLLFYFNGIVEYFTPVIKKEARSKQPLSYLIFEAMIDAVKDGHNIWNWGGTHINQESVYRFKKRWGAVDKEYLYLNKINDQNILKIDPAELCYEYPFFYVYPFGKDN
ncbi:conserved hypothetical protein [Candidatus Terasakiella magnetica]|uniref:BioF2-like acetyltransferase domain-containing protein n=1 Tax=Candidatus Terasakiella magnetica TaxID=1867952 RepID=A0A1C3RGB0_9PROT|nr:GNAT family N-acetyltransferase [Candidatus Terasakiella magnetica]SCA56244.1 conserved hypothetical protein [Candidatus Terasakiella magnetica]